jgi:hypothetical protein
MSGGPVRALPPSGGIVRPHVTVRRAMFRPELTRAIAEAISRAVEARIRAEHFCALAALDRKCADRREGELQTGMGARLPAGEVRTRIIGQPLPGR